MDIYIINYITFHKEIRDGMKIGKAGSIFNYYSKFFSKNILKWKNVR